MYLNTSARTIYIFLMFGDHGVLPLAKNYGLLLRTPPSPSHPLSGTPVDRRNLKYNVCMRIESF
jgi:hypothetical protein